MNCEANKLLKKKVNLNKWKINNYEHELKQTKLEAWIYQV